MYLTVTLPPNFYFVFRRIYFKLYMQSWNPWNWFLQYTYTLLINIYLSHSTQVAEETVFRKHTVCDQQQLFLCPFCIYTYILFPCFPANLNYKKNIYRAADLNGKYANKCWKSNYDAGWMTERDLWFGGYKTENIFFK